MTGNIKEFEPAIIKKYVKKFMVAYYADGKAAAGLVLNTVPTTYKTKIVKQIKKELAI